MEQYYGFIPDFIIKMKQKAFFIFTLVAFLFFIFSCGRTTEHSEVYIMAANGIILGKEIINEKKSSDGGLVLLSEQEIDIPNLKGGKRVSRTKTVFKKGEQFPVSYSYDCNDGVSYNINVEDGQVFRRLKNKSGIKEFKNPIIQDKEISILDMNTVYSISNLIRKYDIKKGRRQVFNAYILPLASVEEISVTPSDIDLPEHEKHVRNYEIEGKLIKAIIWVDKENRLYRAFIPSSRRHIIRADLFDKIKGNILSEKSLK